MYQLKLKYKQLVLCFEENLGQKLIDLIF